ncbi:MAG: hypothetical protein IIC10_05760, partial [Proteobacteria bacterium]|nr:hypothetical protein [Pseudomonadota bacterium]
MFITVLKKVRQQVVLLLAVSLILLAVYVSIGRQFMPAVAGYTEFFEEQFFIRTGVSVSVDSLTGSFQRFNPIIAVNGLSLRVSGEEDLADNPGPALRLDSATVILDVPRSIWQWRLVVEDVVIDTVEIDIVQNQAGEWTLQGLNIEGGGSADLEAAFQLIQRFARLSLTNVSIHLQSFDGDEFSLTNGSATIRNLGQSHQIHINANPEGSSQQIAISLEIEGDDFSSVDGRLHIDVPESNYSSLFSGVEFGKVSVAQFTGGFDLWLELEDGQVSRVVTEVKVPGITLIADGGEPFTLNKLTGKSVLDKIGPSNTWRLALADMSVSWQELDWAPFNMVVELVSGESLLVRADNINLSLLARVAGESGLLSAAAQEQLEIYLPRGALENFTLELPLTAERDRLLTLHTNLVDIDVAAGDGSPAMWGINGYVEATYDPVNRLATGFADLESENFSINIPNLFTHTWDYSYVNGSIGFRVDLTNGLDLHLVSSILVANSDAVDGRAVFTSTLHRPLDGEASSEIELLVGARRVDVTQIALYLPDGPGVAGGLRNTMEWLNRAVIGGNVYDSGVVYRGSTLPGAEAVTKTFQSFFLLANGELEFSEEWPELEGLNALVFTDDGNIDVEVSSGQSLGMELSQVTAVVRRNAEQENWLSINGRAHGRTGQGLNYLQLAPVNQRFRDSLANWEAQGEFSAEIAVRVPLNQDGVNTQVRLELVLAENEITIPDYALDLGLVSGPIVFDSSSGLEPTELSLLLFDRPVEASLSSQLLNGVLEVINVDVVGTVDPSRLLQWPLHSSFVRDLLREMSGEMSYHATLAIQQGVNSTAQTSLFLESDLLGAGLSLPAPLSKVAAAVLPLQLDITLGASGQEIKGFLGPNLNFDLKLANGRIKSGVVYVGEPDENLDTLLSSETRGVAIIGATDRLELDQWTNFLGGLTTDPNSPQGIEDTIAFVDISTQQFVLYGEELPNVDIRIEPSPDRPYWEVALSGEAIQGRVNVPFDAANYIELNLDYLRLPGEEEGEEEEALAAEDASTQAPADIAENETPEAERVDVLAGIDPRQLPRMVFDIKEFSIGSRPFGSWRFTLDPTAEGADISGLAFDFRGLRLGLDGAEAADQSAPATAGGEGGIAVRPQPEFRWLYDGLEHHSELNGVLYADNIGDVLTANGYTASLESSSAVFETHIDWPGSPAFFAADGLSGSLSLDVEDGRFLQGSSATGALKLISIINLNAILTRLRLSNDLVRSGLAFDVIEGDMLLKDGLVTIQDRLVISGPSSLYQITGELDLAAETIDGEMYLTLPLSDNIPWIGLLTANLPLAVGAY